MVTAATIDAMRKANELQTLTEDSLAWAVMNIILMLGMIAVDAWVVSTVWSWAVVPTFGLAPLTLGQAFLLNLMWQAFALKASDKPGPRGAALTRHILKQAASLLVLLGMAWVGAHFFVGVA